jgi:hypothetical protein
MIVLILTIKTEQIEKPLYKRRFTKFYNISICYICYHRLFFKKIISIYQYMQNLYCIYFLTNLENLFIKLIENRWIKKIRLSSMSRLLGLPNVWKGKRVL